MAEYLAAGFGEHGLTGLAVEQGDAEVGFEVGDCGADGGLAFAQLAGSGGEGA
ncbi:hypothetical protein D3C79_784880 [compost metagenome]